MVSPHITIALHAPPVDTRSHVTLYPKARTCFRCPESPVVLGDYWTRRMGLTPVAKSPAGTDALSSDPPSLPV